MSIDSLAGYKAMCGAFTALSVITVTLRFVARKKNQLPLKADDWSMLAAVIFFLGNMTTVYLLARVDWSGYNGGNPPESVNTFVRQVTTAYKLIIVWTLGAAKASVLFLYKRIFCQHRDMNPGFRIAIIVTLVINVCWVIAFFFLGLFQCGNHFSYGPDYFKYCTLLNQYQKGFYISDIILDVWIMVMPIPYIIRLAMSRLKRLLIIIIFLLCFVGLGASIGRLVNYLQTPQVNPAATHHTSTQNQTRTRSAWTTYEWFSTLEMGSAIVAINMPPLYGLFTKHAPEALLKVSRSWTSITSRDQSSTRPRRMSDTSRQIPQPLKLDPTPNGARTVVGADTDDKVSVNDMQANEIHVQRTVQVSSEKEDEIV